jgi:hypothetical protein
LGTAVGFTDVRLLAVFILYHGRPVGTYYGSHQLGEILPHGPVRECTPLSNPPQGKAATWQQRLSLVRLDPSLYEPFFGHAFAPKLASRGVFR